MRERERKGKRLVCVCKRGERQRQVKRYKTGRQTQADSRPNKWTDKQTTDRDREKANER